jgi:hypothetical protein
MDWDSACISRHVTAAQILADNLTKCDSIIKVVHPGAQTYVWSDMFDSLHNAHNNYYLVNGDLSGDWDLIPKNITIANWNGNMRPSLDFFASQGFSQITSPYYDVQNTDNMRAWRIAMEGVPNVKGMMYTTWSADYSFLTPFADYAWSGGPMIVHTPFDTNSHISNGQYVQVEANVFADPYNIADSIVSVTYKENNLLTAYPMLRDTGHLYRYTTLVQGNPGDSITYEIQAMNLEGITRTTPRYLILHIPASKDVHAIRSVDNISIFPNPASNILTIQNNNLTPVSIVIVDLLGREILRDVINSEDRTVDVHELPSGLYECIIRSEAGINEAIPFVKE